MRPALLEINGQRVDLPAILKGVFKFQNAAAALQDLETRTGEYSWPLTLPPTRRNAAVFQQKGHPQALDKFAGSYTFSLTIDGQQWAGTWRPTSYKNGYVGALVMDGFGWALALGDKKLTDLTTLAAIDYDGSQLETILAQDCDGTDVQFPLVSFGNFFGPPQQVTQPDGSTVDQLQADGSTKKVPATKEAPLPASPVLDYPLAVDDYYPSVYYVNLVRAILREAGYFAQGPVLTDPDVRTWCVTAAGGNGSAWPWGALLPASGTGGPQTLYSYFGGMFGFQGNSYANNAAGFDEAEGIVFLPLAVPVAPRRPTRALDAARGVYTAAIEGTYRFRWAATLTSHDQKQADQGPNNAVGVGLMVPICLGLIVQRQGETFAGADGGLLTRGGFDAGQQRVVAPVRVDDLNPGAYAGTTGEVYLAPGDTVRLCLFTRRTWRPAPGSDDGIWRERFAVRFSDAAFDCTHYQDNNGVSLTQLNPAALLPPLSQKDVLKDFLLRTNALLTTDPGSGTATLDFRPGHTAAQGPPVDLTGRLDPNAYEPLPVLLTTAALLFAPADPGTDALVASVPVPPPVGTVNPPARRPALPTKGITAPTYTDAVRAELGSAAAMAGSVKTVQGCFAATGSRTYYLSGTPIELPTAASADALTTPRSETAWDVAGTAPRVVRYLGPSTGIRLPFLGSLTAYGLADYGGSLAWDGPAGAVALRYAATIDQARRGHRLRVPAPLSPARYRQLSPGRAVSVLGAQYVVESITNWDACDDAALCQLELLRVV